MNDFNPQMFEDIRELCICCAKSVAVISQRYNEDPRLVSQLFHHVYGIIDNDINDIKE